MTEIITTPQAAERLGVTRQWIQQLIQAGILSAQKPGRDWMVDAESVARYQANRRGPGRPRKETKR